MFGTDNDTLRLVFLNACQTGAGSVNSDFAALGLDLARFTPAVIAMRTAIKDDDAVRFATAFYRALSNRSDTIDVSLGLARKTLLGSDSRLAFAIPALFSRAEPQLVEQQPLESTPSGATKSQQDVAPLTPPRPSPPPDQLVELMLRPPATPINAKAAPAQNSSHVTVGAEEESASGDMNNDEGDKLNFLWTPAHLNLRDALASAIVERGHRSVRGGRRRVDGPTPVPEQRREACGTRP